MKKKIISAMLAAVMAATVMGFAVPATPVYAEAGISAQAESSLKITDVKADRYLHLNNEYPGDARVGDKIHISFKAEGAEGNVNYTYSVAARNGQYVENIIDAAAPNGEITWTPEYPSPYEIEVRATDSQGNTAYSILHYVISSVRNLKVDLKGDNLIHPNDDVQGYAVVGQDINLQADISDNYEAKYTYKITGVNSGVTKTINSTDGKLTWTPASEDLYVVTANIEDVYGNVGSKTVNYSVSHPLRVDQFLAGRKSDTNMTYHKGWPVEMYVAASGGAVTGKYTYTYDVIPGDGAGDPRFTGSTDNDIYTVEMQTPGKYLVRVTVKDELGNTATAFKNITVID